MRRPVHIEGASAEQGQQGHARMSLQLAIMGDPKADTRHGRAVTALYGDVGTPQHFAEHPLISQTMNIDAAAAGDFMLPHLPGRIPPAGWDGEPGAGAPTAGML